MFINRRLDEDKDLDAMVGRLYSLDRRAPIELLERVKAEFLRANPQLGALDEVPVGEPVVVPEVDPAVPVAATPTTSLSGPILGVLLAVTKQLQAAGERLLAEVNDREAEDTKALDQLSAPAATETYLPEDLTVLKTALKTRLSIAADQASEIEAVTKQLHADLGGLITHFGR